MSRASLALVAIVFAAVAPRGVFAGCPNQCSSHGSCGANDICSCYANFQGSDCSLRTCPFGQAWASNSADPHEYVECSGQGSCDR